MPWTFVGLRDMTNTALWTLLRVCKHWHDVCLADASLWTRINIETTTNVLYGPERPLTHLDHRTQPIPTQSDVLEVTQRSLCYTVMQLLECELLEL